MSVEIVSENKAHGGRQLVVKHPSSATGTDMTFSIFLPPQAERGEKLPLASRPADVPTKVTPGIRSLPQRQCTRAE